MVWHLLGKQAGAIPYRFESCTLRHENNLLECEWDTGGA